MTVSRSGLTCSPNSSMSSAVFPTTVMSYGSSRASSSARRPRRKRAAPIPPASVVTRTGSSWQPGRAGLPSAMASPVDAADAADRWAAYLAQWAVPEPILAGATRSPWGHPVQRFAARADADIAGPTGTSYGRALDALALVRGQTGRPGTVLDVGAGAGA